MTPVLNVTKIEHLRAEIDIAFEKLITGIQSGPLHRPVSSLLKKGKRVRPLITLLACEAAGGQAASAMDAALGIELLHTASLIHDDIMDQATLRRGQPTLHTSYGLNLALLSGDYLVALAYEAFFRVPQQARGEVLRRANTTYRTLCEGQALAEGLGLPAQAAGGGLSEPALASGLGQEHSLDRMIAIIEKKTASLMGFAMETGALIAGASPQVEKALILFGKGLGISFQIQDDILDVAGTEAETGKDRLLDSKNQKATLAGAKEENTLGRAKALSLHYMEEALTALRQIPASEARELLAEFALTLVNRRA